MICRPCRDAFHNHCADPKSCGCLHRMDFIETHINKCAACTDGNCFDCGKVAYHIHHRKMFPCTCEHKSLEYRNQATAERRATNRLPKGRLVTTLGCGHTIEWSSPFPHPGDEVWCAKCSYASSVLSAEFSYMVVCYRCKYVQSHGADLMGARRRGGKHAKLHNHDVVVCRKRKIVEVITSEESALW